MDGEKSKNHELTDTQIARLHEEKLLVQGSWLQKNVAPLLAIIAVAATLALFYLMIFIKLDPTAKDVVLYILGVLSTIVSQIFAYYFGSSAGSRAKQEQLFKKLAD